MQVAYLLGGKLPTKPKKVTKTKKKIDTSRWPVLFKKVNHETNNVKPPSRSAGRVRGIK
jgi:hypothetical protein